MAKTHRPGFITFLTVIGVIQGIFVLLLGIFVIADRNDAELLEKINDSDFVDGHQITENTLLWVGVIAIFLAVVVIIASLALAQGNNAARWVVAIGSISVAASGLHSLIALHGEQQMSGAFSLAFAVFTLWYLFGNDDVDAFFKDAR